jgi:hypothetical protein
MSDGDRQAVEDFKAYLTARAALRDRIAEALYAHDHPSHLVPLNETGMEPAYRKSADAVLAVLPAPTDRAAVLRGAADRMVTEVQQTMRTTPGDARLPGLLAAIEGLRRMADEAQPAEAETEDPLCICMHRRSSHIKGSGRLLCDECDPDSTDNLVCKEYTAL